MATFDDVPGLSAVHIRPMIRLIRHRSSCSQEYAIPEGISPF